MKRADVGFQIMISFTGRKCQQPTICTADMYP